jgi:hypothetical protein
MGVPGIITGGDGSYFQSSIFRDTGEGTRPESGQGVFGRNPGSTAKYAHNRKDGVDAEYRNSMARLFVEVPSGRMREFLATVSPETRPLARVLATAGGIGGGTGFIDFLLTRAQEDFQEKAQIVDTLTDNYVAFYSGQAPPAFQYSGTLLNTYQDDQRVWMLRLYREILRGTRLANRNLICRLRYDSFIVSGYMENLRLSLRGETEHTASDFSFSLRVKRLNIFTASLGAPTVLRTAATGNSLINGEQERASATERVGGVTPETPPTATETPAASPPAQTEEEAAATDTQLTEQGLTSEQRTSVQESRAESTPDPEVQPREVRAQSTTEGRGRLYSLPEDGRNESSATQDGSQGASNMTQAPPNWPPPPEEGTLVSRAPVPPASFSPAVSSGDGGVEDPVLLNRSGQRPRGPGPWTPAPAPAPNTSYDPSLFPQ